jgi:predicted metal-dependent enzyme (double-stranded beta helix superfamily)
MDREQTIQDLMTQVVAVVRANGVSHESLTQVAAHLTSVTAQLPQWRRALRAAQPSEELLYELSINLETGIALYLVSDGSGSISPPHEHQTWAVIAGGSGTELNHIYRRVEEWSRHVVEVERIVLGSGNTLVLTEESIHATEAIGDTPTYHLHLYGKPLSRLPRFSNRTFGVVAAHDKEAAESHKISPG